MLGYYDLKNSKIIIISAPEIEAQKEFNEVKKMLRILDGVMKVERDKSEKTLLITHNRKYGRTADIEATILDSLARKGYGACKVLNPEVPQEPNRSSKKLASTSYRRS